MGDSRSGCVEIFLRFLGNKKAISRPLLKDSCENQAYPLDHCGLVERQVQPLFLGPDAQEQGEDKRERDQVVRGQRVVVQLGRARLGLEVVVGPQASCN